MDEYAVNVNGIEHTMLLNDADAKRLNATPVKKAHAANKKRSAEDK